MNCPICGRDSDCGYEADKQHPSCWCFAEHFPEELLEQVPAELRGQRCICKACLADYKTTTEQKP
ncbi:cysteine-rich CWC family protein [Paenibacillus aurantiacus]|uniref:Cysteine-rich CWC family protein n=1 Tax=Paenibacillus aurantiacus TaxID=1936118 RepID=A0ABV5KYK8_9BACL